MQTYYSFTQFFSNVCNAHPNVTTFDLSDIATIDTEKQTLFPYANLIVNNVSIDLGVMTYNVTLMVMDRVVEVEDVSVGSFNTIDKDYKGYSNVLDVWNTSLMTINDITSYIYRNPDAYQYNVIGASLATPFEERFQNLLAGWAIDMNISVGNTNPMCAISLSTDLANGGNETC
jgi:hypothetical protein